MTNSNTSNKLRDAAAKGPDRLLAEYRDRQKSPRPLPASVAKAYEVMIQRKRLGEA